MFRQIACHCGFSPHAQTARRPGVSRVWVIERSRRESRGVSHWSRAALHRSSASGPQQVWLSKPQEIIYLEPPHCAWLYFSTHFGEVEGVVGDGRGGCTVAWWGNVRATSPVCSQARRERLKSVFNFFSFGCSAFANTIYWAGFIEKAEAVRNQRDLWNCWDTLACCPALATKKYLIVESAVRAAAQDVRQDAAHCSFSTFNSTNNNDILDAETSLCCYK